MAKSKLVKANEKIAHTVVGGYKKIEEGVVGTYKKIEDGFVDKFLTHEGESIEDAKKRLAEEQAQRETATKVAGNQSGPDIGKSSLERSLEIGRASRNAGKHCA